MAERLYWLADPSCCVLPVLAVGVLVIARPQPTGVAAMAHDPAGIGTLPAQLMNADDSPLPGGAVAQRDSSLTAGLHNE